ncbi:MAG: SBBP repeat-containing protein [Ignavibacteriae bacterium]|nr:SBBP repeat-containing protein [Ignavibacteriota bacterium]
MCFSTINAQNVSFDWLKSLGGPNNDVLRGVCIDSSGNIYATGSFIGTTSIANQNFVSNGATDIIVNKFDSIGNLLWAKSLGSVSFDYAFDIDCEPNGNFYITGGFRQTLNFSPSISLISSGEMDLFTAKFDTLGNCIWAKSATGYSSEYGNEIVTTANGNVAVIGNTQGTIVFTTDTLFHMDSTDLFLVKYDSNGNEIWCKGLPGLGNAGGRAISTDDFENTIIAGSFAGNIYIDTVIFNSTTVPNNDIYISKFSPTGTLIWAKQFGGTGDDYARGIDADANGNIYVSGVFSNSVNFDGITLAANGSSDIFLMKLDSNGNIIWIKQIGNLGAEEGCEIEALPSGDIFITGGFSQTIILGSNNYTALGMRDVFIAKIDSSGNIIWAKTAGSAMDDVNYAIGLNMYNEDVCTVGTYSGSFTDGLNSITSLGGVDSYISKIKSSLTTSINDIINSSTTIAIHPNPSNTIINVDCKKGFQIYSSTGQLVKQSSQATTQINISDLPTGLYILKTENQQGRFIKTE